MPLFRVETEAYRLPRGDDAVWPPVRRAYGGPTPPSRWRRLGQPALAAARLILPVSLTLVLLGATYLYADANLPLAGMTAMGWNGTLAISDLVLPLTWFSIQLTNRRYGPAYAFAQLLVALVLATLVILANPYDLNNLIAPLPAFAPRAVFSFGAAFLTANFVAITFFDGMRGPRWWTAPLAGSIAASVIFSAIYYPAAFAGVDEGWMDSALTHVALFLAMSVLLLIPYWLLRPAMRPMPGLNGY